MEGLDTRTHDISTVPCREAAETDDEAAAATRRSLAAEEETFGEPVYTIDVIRRAADLARPPPVYNIEVVRRDPEDVVPPMTYEEAERAWRGRAGLTGEARPSAEPSSWYNALGDALRAVACGSPARPDAAGAARPAPPKPQASRFSRALEAHRSHRSARAGCARAAGSR